MHSRQEETQRTYYSFHIPDNNKNRHVVSDQNQPHPHDTANSILWLLAPADQNCTLTRSP
jgi:hypothetical protein